MSLDSLIDETNAAPDPAAALRALVVVSPDGRIQFATVRANLWMRDLLRPVPPRSLPEALTRWLANGASGGYPSRFILDQPGERFCVNLICREADSVCLLLERSRKVPATLDARSVLTKRQIEVLSWVAYGKTNAEIGKILSLKTRTIGKYLERIFPKLGVENRTSAARFALEASGAN